MPKLNTPNIPPASPVPPVQQHVQAEEKPKSKTHLAKWAIVCMSLALAGIALYLFFVQPESSSNTLGNSDLGFTLTPEFKSCLTEKLGEAQAQKLVEQIQLSRSVPKSLQFVVDACKQTNSSPGASALPSVSPTASSQPGVVGIPFGPFHFGENKAGNDYADPLTSAFSGSFIYLDNGSSSQADTLLKAAKDNGHRIVVSTGKSYPCTYWNGSTFNSTLFVSDTAALLPTVVKYWPATVVGLQLLNEPHDPQPECKPGIPVKYLYDSVKQIRSYLSSNYESSHPGISKMYIGFDAPPTYFEDGLKGDSARSSTDGTINLAMIQWTPRKGGGATATEKAIAWAAPQKAAAARMGMRLNYSVNTRDASLAETLEVNKWECQQTDALEVWWYNWSDKGGTNAVSHGFEGTLADWQTVRDICSQH